MLALLAETTIDAHEGAGDHGSSGASGFPAFEMWHWPGQIFWLILIFSLLYLVLSRVILPRIASTIERRGTRIASDLDEAAGLNDKAKEAEQALSVKLGEARARAHDTAAEARADIEAEIAEATRKVDEEISQQLAEAETKIADMRREAMTNVESIAADAAEAMMSRFGRPVSRDAALKAVKSALN